MGHLSFAFTMQTNMCICTQCHLPDVDIGSISLKKRYGYELNMNYWKKPVRLAQNWAQSKGLNWPSFIQPSLSLLGLSGRAIRARKHPDSGILTSKPAGSRVGGIWPSRGWGARVSMPDLLWHRVDLNPRCTGLVSKQCHVCVFGILMLGLFWEYLGYFGVLIDWKFGILGFLNWEGLGILVSL